MSYSSVHHLVKPKAGCFHAKLFRLWNAKKTIFRHRLSARNSVPVEKSHNIFSSLAVYHLCLTESLICLTKIRKMYFNVFFFSYFNYALFIKLFIIWSGKQNFFLALNIFSYVVTMLCPQFQQLDSKQWQDIFCKHIIIGILRCDTVTYATNIKSEHCSF